ncbi:PREDICTED: RING-H2 finger protein ATL43-like [Lupinus angustifolius]|uniref:RING-H2 finger protein ATL43-like n=1 Tax=Lupinus angustifolius TaxID=3871 RepID=UPI00092E66EB|nr:PREDICTED: RING-H2 finger protein ATL43-like [Lupinus angustifolius]
MVGAPSFKPLFFITTILIILPIIIAITSDNDDTRETHNQIPKPNHYNHDDGDDNGGIATTAPTVSKHFDHDHQGKKSSEPLKPSTAIVVCVLTTVCSITFMILLYIKHCIDFNNASSSLNNPNNNSSEERKNSGVERSVVESLPIFRFGSLTGHKEGLECVICLKKLEDHEFLRLLPKCDHAFHVECVDMWLNAHSTCPLCRDKVDLEDVAVVDQQHLPSPSLIHNQSNNHNEDFDINNTVQPQNLSHGINDGFIEINLDQKEETSSNRRSLDDSAMRRIKGNREDMTLVTQGNEREKKKEEEHRLEHRIIVSNTTKSSSPYGSVPQKRWSNVEQCDLLYLTSDMIISESSATATSLSQQQQHRNKRMTLSCKTHGGGSMRNQNVEDEMEKGRVNMNMRSVSETTGMNRNRGREGEEERHEGVVKRWLAWISKTHSP